MGHIIGRGHTARETYPEARLALGGGAILRMGFDNSVEDLTYVSATPTPMLRAAGTPLAIPLTGFTPGNLILIQFSVTAQDSVGSGPVSSSMLLLPTVDLGAGPRTLHVQSPEGVFVVPMTLTFIAFVRPVPGEVAADPVIALLGVFAGIDPTRIKDYGALLIAAEIAASTITQMPTTFLDP